MVEKSYIAVDFDGTVVTHEYPLVGRTVENSVEVLNELCKKGHLLVLNTMRSDKYLQDAVNWFKNNDIPLFGINHNPTQSNWTNSPKVYAHLYIDDAALGCPLINNGIDRPYVNWKEVREYLVSNKYI